VNRFLRLIPQFRTLEASLRVEAESRTLLQDQVIELRGQNELLRKQVTDLQAQANNDARATADYLAQLYTGRKVFGVGPDVVFPKQESVSVERIPSGRQLVQDGYRRFYEEAAAQQAEYLKHKQDEPAPN
jgi:hypothetical protein